MNKHLLHLSTVGLLIFVLSACSGEGPSGGNFVWIDVPINELSVPLGQSVQVEGHATSFSGVARIDIWIDGRLVSTINDPPATGDLARFSYGWTPPGEGEYVIQAVGFDSNGVASEADTARIFVVGLLADAVAQKAPTLVPSVTDTPTVTPVPPETVAADIQFWAEPAEIQAGACTTIYWQAENVQEVVFGGIQQPLEGSLKDCFCKNERFTLNVTHLNGTEEKLTVDITVTGACIDPTETPTPPPPSSEKDTPTPTSPPSEEDTTPPPVPSPAVPDDGLTLSCRGSQSLVWLPVDDPSGIANYEVKLQRHSGDNNWQAVGGSPFTVGDKTVDVSVECGWYYRWRVRAVDGEGNVGSWSDWWKFTITLA